MTHDILLLQTDIDDQIMLGVQFHLEHEHKAQKIEEKGKKNENRNSELKGRISRGNISKEAMKL